MRMTRFVNDPWSSGLRPDSQYSDHPMKGHHPEFSEDDQSVRTVIEIDASGQPVYRGDRISPGTYQTYLVDDPCAALMPFDYADIPSGANYAEALRNNSLQRKLAGGQYSPTTGYPEDGGPPMYCDVMEEGLPPPMGPLRTLSEELNQYAPYSHYSNPSGRANGLIRRYSPVSGPGQSPPPPPSATAPSGHHHPSTSTFSSSGATVPTAVTIHGDNPAGGGGASGVYVTPYAEVRPIVTARGDRDHAKIT